MLPAAVARSSYSSAIRYVLPVLWMTSSFHVMERMGKNRTRHVCFVQFAGWRHRGVVCRLRLFTCPAARRTGCRRRLRTVAGSRRWWRHLAAESAVRWKSRPRAARSPRGRGRRTRISTGTSPTRRRCRRRAERCRTRLRSPWVDRNTAARLQQRTNIHKLSLSGTGTAIQGRRKVVKSKESTTTMTMTMIYLFKWYNSNDSNKT